MKDRLVYGCLSDYCSSDKLKFSEEILLFYIVLRDAIYVYDMNYNRVYYYNCPGPGRISAELCEHGISADMV